MAQPQNNRPTAGSMLACRRKEMGLSQEQLAQKLHVTRQTVSGWERDRTQPDLDALRGLAAHLNLDLNELICGTVRAGQSDKGGRAVLALYLSMLVGLAAYWIFRAVAGGFSFTPDGLPIIVLLAVTITFLPLQYCAKTGDFTILAGYDAAQAENYRPGMLQRMARALQLFLCLSGCAFCALFLVFRFAGAPEQGYGFLMALFAVDYVAGLLVIVIKYQPLLYQTPQKPAYAVYGIIAAFAAAVGFWVGASAFLSERFGVENNTPRAVNMAALTFVMLLLALPWLVRELLRAIRAHKAEERFRLSRLTYVAGALYLGLVAALCAAAAGK